LEFWENKQKEIFTDVVDYNLGTEAELMTYKCRFP
jgi:hypothetical protein